MKKISLLLLAILLVCGLFVLTSCGGNDTNTDSGSTNTDAGSQPEVDEDLNAAYNYIKLTYKTLGTTTKSFEVMKNAPIGDKIFAITWSTDNEAVTITESEDGNFYVVNVPELGDTALNYSLKFSIENEKGEKKMGSFSLTVPAFAVNTFEEYAAAEDGTALVVQGIVTGVISKTDGNKENSIFVQDFTEGGYYVYGLEEDPKGTVSVGMTVEVRGNKKNYSGTYELVDATVTVIDSSINPVEPVDFTEIFASADSLDAAELIGVQGMLVTIKGVTILEYNDGNGYHNFQLGNHKSYLRVSSSSNCITKDEGKTLTENFQANFYNAADVTGIIAVYSGNMYLMPASVDAFTNIVEQVKPDDVKVDTALENTTLPGIIQVNGTTNLPTSFSGFSDVAISWELVAAEGVDCAAVRDNVLSVTVPESAQTITLKATATCGEYSDTKDFEIVVKPISTITIQEANDIGMNMAHNTYTEELYYIVGTIDSIASDIYGNLYLVDETGEFSIYVYGLYDETGDVRYDKMNPTPLVKDTIKVLSPVGKYKNDVQLKNAKVVEHTVHPDNENQGGGSEEVVFTPANPIVGTKYYFGMLKNDSVYYITGSMATGNASYYMASTTNAADSAVITVVAGPTADTYYITLTVNGATKYMDLVVSGTHKNAVYVDAAPEVGFSFDAEYKVFYKELDGSNYTFGTALSNTFYTIGGVKVSADNAMLQISLAEAHTCTFEDVVTPPTCEEEGYTTHTCVCGNVVVDTYVDALGHSYENGTCTVCGAIEHEHVYEEVVTAPTCYQAGYTTYTCNVCGHSYTGNEVAATGAHADNNGDYKCDTNGCKALVLPADGSTLTIKQALAIGELQAANVMTEQKYYVTGTITEVYNTTYGNMYITDGTDTITVYGLYKDGTRYDKMAVKPVAGEEITVYGALTSYSSKAQFKNAELYEHNAHTCVGGDEATCTTAQTCTVCGKVIVAALGHNYANGACTVCGAEQPVAGETVLPENLVFTGLANKASADTYMAENFPEWTITGKLGTGYADYLGFGRGGGDAASSIKSTAISTSTAFTVTAVIKGNGSNGAMTSTLTFTLVDASGNVVATGYANGSTTAAITPVDATDTTYDISFTFVEGKTWSDVSNLVVSFNKAAGNIGLKSLDFVQ